MTSKEFKLGVLASGRGTNLQAVIDQIENGDIPARISVILSNRKEAPALERGRKHNIESRFVDPKLFPKKEAYDAELASLLKDHGVDLVCLAGYMRILGKGFIQAFKGKIINIHPSLLPAFPGLDVQQKAIDRGVKVSGCTVHFVNEEVDAGPIILQAAVPVKDHDDADTLSARILEQEHIIYPQAIRLIAEGRIRIERDRVVLQDSPTS